MKHSDFKIGEKFFASAGFEWLCTDKGTRTITAIMLDPDKDVSWFNGPPYAVEEVVFDEDDFSSCQTSQEELIINRLHKKSVHPGFDMEDFTKMIKEWENNSVKFKDDKILKKDRVSLDGKIFHPYGKEKKDGKTYIKIFEIFSHEYLIIDENEFVCLPYSSEDAMIKRNHEVNGK